MSSKASSQTTDFGPNLWLVDELYQLFLDDPSAVDESWHEFFADYRPSDAVMAGDDVGDLDKTSMPAPTPATHTAAQVATRPVPGEAGRGRVEGGASGGCGRGGHGHAVAGCRRRPW